MDIILLKDVDKVGYKHDLVTVKNGYGRNYLIPQGLAMIANAANREKLAEIRKEEEAREAAMVGTYKEIASKVEGKTLKIGAKAGTSGKIFGSITNVQIIAALKDQYGVEVERRKVVLPNDIKNLGTYELTLNLYTDIQPKMTFEVIEE